MFCLKSSSKQMTALGLSRMELRKCCSHSRGHCKAPRAQQLRAQDAAPTSMNSSVAVPKEFLDAAVAKTINKFNPKAAHLKPAFDLVDASNSCEALPTIAVDMGHISRDKATQQARRALKYTRKQRMLCTDSQLPKNTRMHVEQSLESHRQLPGFLESLQQDLQVGSTAVETAEQGVESTAAHSTCSPTAAVSTCITATDTVNSHPIDIDTVRSEAPESTQQPTSIVSGVAATRGTRSHMEDFSTSNSLHPDAGVLPAAQHDSSSGSTFMAAVYDGHGGRSTAAFAAAHMPSVLHQHLYSSSSNAAADNDDLKQTMTQACRELDERCENEGLPGHSGSTAVVALVRKDKLVVANAGDSVAVLCRKGQAVRLTATHNTSNPDERDRIEAAGGLVLKHIKFPVYRLYQHPVRVPSGLTPINLSVTRGFGDYGFKGVGGDLVVPTPHVTEVQLSHNDQFVLLTSDGVTDVMTDGEMVKVAMNAVHKARGEGAPTGQLAHIVASAVKDKAMRKGAWDNVTVAALLLDWDDA